MPKGILTAVADLFDTYVEYPATMMAAVEGNVVPQAPL